MPKLTNATPKLRKHKASGQAVVTIAGKDHYLGRHGTKAAQVEYDRLIGEWLAAGRPVRRFDQAGEITVVELIRAYWRFVQQHYRKDGKPTGEQAAIKAAIRLVKQRYGKQPISEFGPLALKAIRSEMIVGDRARTTINANVGRICRMFNWGVAEELVPVEVYQRLASVKGLRKGKTKARETAPILPVADDIVEKTLPKLPAVVADMVRFERLTGCRPSEVCKLRPCDVDTSGDVWPYVPESHKTEHHNRQRVVFIGPKAQEILRPYLLREQTAYCFSPADSERKRRREMHAQRSTPLSCGNRPGTNKKRKPKRSAGQRYTADSYRRAIHRACDKAGIDRWSPNRLRHSQGTDIRRRYGVEAAQVVLGHASADVTQVYAERDLERAAEIMRQVG